MIYRDLGRFSEALPLLEDGYRLYKDVLGEKHPDTLTSLINLAGIYRELGRLSEALPLFEDGYRLSKEVLGEKHPETLASLNNLAGIYLKLGSLEEALSLFEEGYRLSQETLGEKYPQTLVCMNCLAATYSDLGRYEEALPLFEENYRLSKEVLGEKHPNTLSSLINLAGIYQDLGRLSEALPLYEDGYRFRKEVLGEKHPDTLSSLNNLAMIYQDLGRFSEALPLLEDGYRLSKEVLGEKHPNTLLSINNLALIYQDLGRFSEALPLFEDNYRLSKEVLGEKHPDTFKSQNNLAYAYAEQGQLDKAIQHFEQLVEGLEDLRQRGDLSAENRQALFKQWIHSYFKLSQLYLEKGKSNDAFQTAEKTKARTLLESMTVRLAAQKAGLNQADMQQVQRYQGRIAVFNGKIARETDINKRLSLERQKNQVVREAAAFHRTLMQKYPRYAQLNDIQFVDANTGASLIPPEALFISYLVSEDNKGKIPNLDQTLKTYTELLGEKCTVKQLRRRACGSKYVWRLADGSFTVGDKPARAKKPKREKTPNNLTRRRTGIDSI